MSEEILIRKVAWIIEETEDRVKWDMPKYEIIEKLVERYEELIDEMKERSELYER
jgi:hypothetical protein